jgi:hypothetical protein
MKEKSSLLRKEEAALCIFMMQESKEGGRNVKRNINAYLQNFTALYHRRS